MQTPSLQGRLQRGVAPSQGQYNLVTGFSLGAHSYRSGPETIFDNTDGTFYYFGTMQVNEEWVDSIAFPADEISGYEQINGFRYEYCSILPAPNGDAITSEVRFYEENLVGSPGVVGWSDPVAGTVQNSACTYILSGLPGHTGLGLSSCWAISVDLTCGFECSLPQELTPGGATEFNGVGWMHYDATGANATGPSLGSIFTPAGPNTAIPGYGNENGFILYDLTQVGNEYQGYWWSGCAKACGTFRLILFGDGITDTDVINPASPDLGDVLCLSSDAEFRSGSATTYALNDFNGSATFPSAAYAMLFGTSGRDSGFGPLAGPGTTLLIHPGSLIFPITPLPMSGAVPNVTTPNLPGLPPTVWAQAFGFNGGIGAGNAAEASNALRHNN